MNKPDSTDKPIDLKENGLLETSSRVSILKVLENKADDHLSAEEIFKELEEDNNYVPLSTVYRVLARFEKAGIVRRMLFEPNRGAVFEISKNQHDHMICVKCGAVAEFIDTEIEEREMHIASELGFELTGHSHNMYGRCSSCINSN